MQWKAELLGVRAHVWACVLLGLGSLFVLDELGSGHGEMEATIIVDNSPAVEATKIEAAVRSHPPSFIHLSTPAERKKAAILQRLSDPDSNIRLKTLEELDALELPKAESVPLLTTCLSDADSRVRAYAALRLGSLRMLAMDAVPTLKHLARTDTDELVRSRAKDALCNIRLYDYSPMIRDW